MDWRERLEQAVPLLATVASDPNLTGCRAKVECRRLEVVDIHAVALDRKVTFLLGEAASEPLPRAASILAAPDGGRAARARACHCFVRHHVYSVWVVRVYDDWKSEIGWQPLGDRPPRLAVVVA